MEDAICLLNQFIVLDIFIGYGVYSLLVFPLFKRTKLISKLDDAANKLIAGSGLLYLISFLIMINLAPPPQISDARYWWGLWIQPIIWLSATQLVRFDRVKRSIIARIVISLLLIVSFERFVIIVTSFHRDYVPSGWATSTASDTIPAIILAMILKGMIFCALAYGYLYLKNKLRSVTPDNQ
ncbi:MAG TPA: hypothetical protein VIU12_26495 [Chryseolinea sp.]